ncbi:MAG: hypothetical protein VYB44_07380 [Bacteroidota bacterium]|nr:hypothetical protein [Bacteroidota bacterium]
MTKIERLIETWRLEKEDFKRVNEKLQLISKNLGELNVQIYNECLAQGIDINTLNL